MAKRETKVLNLEKLLLIAVSSSPRTNFPIEDVCAAFSASAASLWLAGDLDRSELVLAAAFGRPDLENQYHRAAFTIDNSFVSKLSPTASTPFFYIETSEAAQYHWDNDVLRNFTINNFHSMLVINFFSKTNIIVGSLILYYKDEAPSIPNDEVRTFANVMGYFIDTLSNESRGMVEERRKIGHEIGRLINACEAAISVFEESKNIRQKKRLDMIKDMRESLSAARAASENETFIEGVLHRKLQARFINLRSRFLNVSFSALNRHSLLSRYIFDSINISSNMIVKINEQDLDLLISNIVSNAAKYTVKESFVAKIQQRGSVMRLRVSNPSNAMLEAEHERVWRYGYRGTNAGDEDGNGIGLTVVKDICRAYGIRHRLYQDKRFSQDKKDSQVWTHVSLDFPPELWRWSK